MKAGRVRKHTVEFRQAAVQQVLGGRGTTEVARSLEMSVKTMNNWVARRRRGQALLKRAPPAPVSDLEAEVSRSNGARPSVPPCTFSLCLENRADIG